MSSKGKFVKPSLGPSEDAVEKELEKELDLEMAKFNPNADLSYDIQRKQLPVFKYRDHILYLLEKHRVVIIVAETGGGKSTQIPQYLFEKHILRLTCKSVNF